MAGLPTTVEAALEEIADVERQIAALEQELIVEDDDNRADEEERAKDASVDWLPPAHCVPICADVRDFDFAVRC